MTVIQTVVTLKVGRGTLETVVLFSGRTYLAKVIRGKACVLVGQSGTLIAGLNVFQQMVTQNEDEKGEWVRVRNRSSILCVSLKYNHSVRRKVYK